MDQDWVIHPLRSESFGSKHENPKKDVDDLEVAWEQVICIAKEREEWKKPLDDLSRLSPWETGRSEKDK